MFKTVTLLKKKNLQANLPIAELRRQGIPLPETLNQRQAGEYIRRKDIARLVKKGALHPCQHPIVFIAPTWTLFSKAVFRLQLLQEKEYE